MTDWSLGVMPNIGQNALAAFQQGVDMRRQQDTRKALSAYAANPNEQSLNALAPYAPEVVIQQRQQMATTQRQQEELAAKRHQEQIGVIGRLLSNVRDEPTYQQALAAARQGGIDLTDVPQTFDPNWVNQTKMLVDAYSADGGQKISAAGQKALDLGYQRGTPEFVQVVAQILEAEQAKPYVVGGETRLYRPSFAPQSPQQAAPQQAAPQQAPKITSFEAAASAAQQMGPQFPEFVRNNGFRVQVATPEQAMQLPSGTPLILPDGSEGVVP